MGKQDKIAEINREEATDIKNVLVASVLMNNYTLENVAFGKLKPNDHIPFDRYIEELKLQQYNPYSVREYITGRFITEKETVADKDEEEFIMECFLFHINFVFSSAPKRIGDFGDDLFQFKRGFGKYIMSLYPLFKQIIKTDVETDLIDFSSPFNKRSDETECYAKISKFLVAIKSKGLRQGSCINRYVKNLHYIPYYVQRLIKKEKNRYLLANSDTDSLDYKLAILSAIHFMNFEHTKLFKLKAQKWEIMHK